MYSSWTACLANIIIGDVVYISAFGTNIILLGTHQAAADLLEKKSAIYSDRDFYDYSKL